MLILVDELALNLRNGVAHGLSQLGNLNEVTANNVLYLFFMLLQFRLDELWIEFLNHSQEYLTVIAEQIQKKAPQLTQFLEIHKISPEKVPKTSVNQHV